MKAIILANFRVRRSFAFAMLMLALPQTALAQETSLFRRPVASSRSQGSILPGSSIQGSAPMTSVSGQSTQGIPLSRLSPAEGSPSGATPGYGDVGLASASWTYSPPSTTRTYRIQDIVTIRVDEIARTRADGIAESRRSTLYDAILKDWIAIRKGDLGTDNQTTGDPRINGQSSQLYRANSSIESRESIAFNLAARVVDIQPNGNLVLEARKTIRSNDNVWQTALTGICRAQDIAPDNVVLSKDLLDLSIVKDDEGQLRDGYRRGWLTRWINEFNPL